jgi:TonB family protein
MRYAVLAIAALSCSLSAAPALAETQSLAPNGPWAVDFAEDKCRLVRMFGEGEDTHFLAFQQYWPANTAGLTVAGPQFRKFRSRARTDVRFFEAQSPFETKPFTGTVGEYGNGVIWSNIGLGQAVPETNTTGETGKPGLPMFDPALAKQVQFLEVKQGGQVVRLETGALDEAVAVLNQCTLDLLREWGLDPERHLTAQSAPRWLNEEALVRRIIANYPRDAAAQGEQGIMRMRVIVSAEGAVEECVILKATNTVRLDSPACEVMQRAQFAPARDANGEPFRSLFATSITYVMQ